MVELKLKVKMQSWTAVSTWLSLAIKSARFSNKNKPKQNKTKTNKQLQQPTRRPIIY